MISLTTRLVPDGADGADGAELLERIAAKGARLVTLGPVGTSSYDAARHLRDTVAGDPSELTMDTYDDFDGVLSHVVADPRSLAVVPSAYCGVTRFHWHPELALLFHFVRRTPTYGLAVRQSPEARSVLRVAAMDEVRGLYSELVPPALADVPVVPVPARSTSHAAEMAAGGHADIAVTNDPSRRATQLTWLSSCPGADMVWLIFGRRRHRSGVDHLPVPEPHRASKDHE